MGPSLEILGGQSVQAKRLLDGLASSAAVDVEFLPVNPRFSAPLRWMQRVKLLRTVATSVAYGWSLLRAVRHTDVVHAFSASYWSYLLAPLPAMLAARLWGKPAILNYHSGEAADHLARWPRSRATMRALAARIVVPSQYLVNVFGNFAMPATSIANVIPLEQLPFRERRTIRPAFFSNRNLEPLYNVACTLRAFARVQAVHAHATLVVAGDGSCREELLALAKELNLRNVEFVGRVAPERMGELYDQADVYVNSPNIDNMPLSIIEAFACGLPVVSTDAGGIPFVVDHGRTGLLVGIADDHAMASAMLGLIDDPELAREMARAAREECLSRYVWPAVREAWEQLYLGLARTPAEPRAATPAR
ncbi:MAG: glycosyltransferase family 4 protein [Gemmatimonadota bacterium]